MTAQSSPASAVLPATGADTLATLLARRGREQGKSVFLVFEDLAGNVSTFTYATMLRRAARLAPFKVPSFVDVVEQLPRTSVGKIQKHLLRLGAAGGRTAKGDGT